jgi:hypothetical protein
MRFSATGGPGGCGRFATALRAAATKKVTHAVVLVAPVFPTTRLAPVLLFGAVTRASRIPRNTGVCACVCMLSCATYGARPKSPAEGGATWTRVESQHFIVVSDLPREEAESTARELEQGLEALTNVVFERPRTPVEHTTVVVFQDSSDFHAFMPSMVEGKFYPHLSNDPEGPRFLVVHGNLMTDDRIPFFHELTHDLFDRNFGSSPPWLREGWAEYWGITGSRNGSRATKPRCEAWPNAPSNGRVQRAPS